MSAPDDAMFPSLRSCHDTLNANVAGARRVLWQELQQLNQPRDQLAQMLERVGPERQQAASVQFLSTWSPNDPVVRDGVTIAQRAIWRLFEAGLIDDSSATVALLAIHVGIRRRTTRHETDVAT
jgi:hypothetical protein